MRRLVAAFGPDLECGDFAAAGSPLKAATFSPHSEMKRKILIQLDSDPQASTFDAVVAVDAGVDFLFRQQGVEDTDVRALVHGAMFTRGGEDLKSTAIFVGGSNVEAGEALLEQVKRTFFGPVRVSVMMDANGANTTAAAAVLVAGKHVPLAGATALVLGATGPVGQRAVRLLARQGATVHVGSRAASRAKGICEAIAKSVPGAMLVPHGTLTPNETVAALAGVQVIIAAGAAGAQLLSAEARKACSTVKVAIDLNAVPPAGLEGVEVMDRGVERDGAFCYGAIGVGGTKMKIHKAALQKLFERNDLVLDAEEIYELGRSLLS